MIVLAPPSRNLLKYSARLQQVGGFLHFARGRKAMQRINVSWRLLETTAWVGILLGLCAMPAVAQDAPLLHILDQFTAADVPARGPSELPASPRSWLDPTTNPSAIGVELPGKGL